MAGFRFFGLFNRQPANTHFGLYRGIVLDNADPMQLGRIIAQVPDVCGETPSSWAMPCVPLAGVQMGTVFVPQIGSQVWMQFEQGNPDYPVWTGGFWGNAAQVPTQGAAGPDPNIIIQSELQNAIVVSDLPGPTGGIMLKSTLGATIIVNDTGIYIQNGKGASITMIGPSVDVNEGKLVLT